METFERVNELLNSNYKSDFEIDWWYISRYQKLSEDFIREFQDKVIWYWISKNQKLSEDFIREFQDNVDWSVILDLDLSDEIIEELYSKIFYNKSIKEKKEFLHDYFEK